MGVRSPSAFAAGGTEMLIGLTAIVRDCAGDSLDADGGIVRSRRGRIPNGGRCIVAGQRFAE